MATKLKMAVYFAEETFWVGFPKTCRTIVIEYPFEITEHDWRDEWKRKFPSFLNQIRCFYRYELGQSGQVTLGLVDIYLYCYETNFLQFNV